MSLKAPQQFGYTSELVSALEDVNNNIGPSWPNSNTPVYYPEICRLRKVCVFVQFQIRHSNLSYKMGLNELTCEHNGIFEVSRRFAGFII